MLTIDFISVSIIVSTTAYATSICYNAFSCANEKIDHTGYIYGYGYKSIYGINASINATGGQIRCYGTLSCSQVQFIKSSYYPPYAFGVNAISYSNGPIRRPRCWASHSCANSLIQYDSGGQTYSGDQSAKGSTIYLDVSASLSDYGAFAFKDSIVYSNGNNLLLFRGLFAGYNTTVNCQTGDTCNIYCYGNGCFGVRLNCSDNCNVNNCDESNSVACPINITDTLNETILSSMMVFDISQQSSINEQACNINNQSFVFDDYSEASGSTLISSNDNICCRGYRACYGTTRIELNTPNTMVSCSGMMSCDNSGTIDAMVMNGAIYCGGYWACRTSTIIAPKLIYCGSYEACDGSTMSHADTLVCNGRSSCQDGIISNISNVYFGGWYSGADTKIWNNGTKGLLSVHFMSWQSGINSIIGCSEDSITSMNCDISVVCYTNTACQDVTINCIEGQCDVDCDDAQGRTCPSVNYYNISAVAAQPSSQPSNDPSTVPSNIPSAVPTSIPTSNPTNVPTGIATTVAATIATTTSMRSTTKMSMMTAVSTTESVMMSSTDTTMGSETTSDSITTQDETTTMIMTTGISSSIAMLTTAETSSFAPSDIKSRTNNGGMSDTMLEYLIIGSIVLVVILMISCVLFIFKLRKSKNNINDNHDQIGFQENDTYNRPTINIRVTSNSTNTLEMNVVNNHSNETNKNANLNDNVDHDHSETEELYPITGNDNAATLGGGGDIAYVDGVAVTEGARGHVQGIGGGVHVPIAIATGSISNAGNPQMNTITAGVGSEGMGIGTDSINMAIDTDIGRATTVQTSTSVRNTEGEGIGGDKSDWQNWTDKQVITWLRDELTKNVDNQNEINVFLKEFSKHNIGGKVILSIKEDSKLLQQLKNQFENQSFGIWVVVDRAITQLD